MAAVAWALTDNARMRRAKGSWNIDTATLKCALFLSTSNLGSSSTTYAAVTNQHSNANGYTTGGVSVDLAFSGTSIIHITFISNPAFTAAGGSIVCRSAAVYEVSGDVLAYSILDTSDITTTSGTTLTLDNDGVPDDFFTFT